VNPDSADLEIATLLSVIGRVDPPEPGTLAAASEALWSAVAAELLVPGNGPPQTARRQQGRPHPAERRRGAGPGA
jgi:hypothetical protein